MAAQIVTANLLSDGSVAYLTADGGWSSDVNAALAVPDGDDDDDERLANLMAEAEAAVGACRVVAPYAIAVEVEKGEIRPVRFRERIRAAGPTAGLPEVEAKAEKGRRHVRV